MPACSEFVAFVVDSLAPLGEVEARRLFGGYGVFSRGRMFALVMDDVLYFRTDDGNRPDFEAEGLPVFSYPQRGREVRLPYHQAPSDALDDPEVLHEWGREALAAALRTPLS